MKRILLAFAVILGLTLYSCGGYSVDDIEAETQVSIVDSISENFDISPNNIEVTSYTLIQETNSVYTDVMETEYDGYTQTLDIKVTWDHNSDKYIYEWELISEN